MSTNTPLLNTTFQVATGMRAKNALLAARKTQKNAPKWKNSLFGWMKNIGSSTNNASTISGSSPPESVYNSNSNSVGSNISINSIVSPLESSPKRTNNLTNEQLQLGVLETHNIPLASIKDRAAKEWLRAHPNEYSKILASWAIERPSNNATLPPSFVTEKVLEMMKGQRGSGRKSRKARRSTRRKTRRSNRK